MKEHDYDYIPGQWGNTPASPNPVRQKQRKGISVGVCLSVVAVVAVLCILFTYTLTAAAKRSYYSEKLQAQQEELDALKESLDHTGFSKLDLLENIFQSFSYYAGELSEEEISKL